MTIYDVKHLPYSPARYMSLRKPKPVLIDLKPRFVPTMKVLRDISLKHGMGSLIGVTLLHRHHILREEQVLVEHIAGGVSTTAPASLNDLSEFLIPHTFELDLDENTKVVRLIPLEFLDVRSEGINAIELREVVAQLESNTAFTTEICEALVASGTTQLLGLQLIHRESMIDRNNNKLYMSEISTHKFNGDDDVSIITAVTELPPDSVPVFWFIKESSTYCEGCIPERPGEGLAVHIPHEAVNGEDDEPYRCKGGGCDCGGHCGCG